MFYQKSILYVCPQANFVFMNYWAISCWKCTILKKWVNFRYQLNILNSTNKWEFTELTISLWLSPGSANCFGANNCFTVQKIVFYRAKWRRCLRAAILKSHNGPAPSTHWLATGTLPKKNTHKNRTCYILKPFRAVWFVENVRRGYKIKHCVFKTLEIKKASFAHYDMFAGCL